MKKYKKIILDGKKIKLKTKIQEANAFANLSNTITITNNLKDVLNKKEVKAVLMHERGHLEITNKIISILLVLAVLAIISFFIRLSLFNILLLNIFLFVFLFIILIIVEIPFCWLREFLADKYAVNHTEKGVLKNGIKKLYNYNNQSRNIIKRFYISWILHPPRIIRFYFIDLFERKKKQQ